MTEQHTHQHTEHPKKEEKATESKKEVAEKKTAKVEHKAKKDEASAYGRSMHMSKKQGMYICDFIRGKKIDDSIVLLGQVMKLKKVVPFRGEIPHRKGKGIMSGRYPVKASGQFINLLKGLKGNVIANGMELDKVVISHASANWAYRPMRSGNRKGKKTHILLKAAEMKKHG